MKTELIAALIAGAVASASAAGTIWNTGQIEAKSEANAKAIELLKIENDRRKDAERRSGRFAQLGRFFHLRQMPRRTARVGGPPK